MRLPAVADVVACPAMPSVVDGLLPPDLLRAVCEPGRDQLALVARSWRAALRPVVGRQVVEGRGWAAWILPIEAGEWVERNVPTDVLARVARAWRRCDAAPHGWRLGRPIRVGPSSADVELALELAPTELHIVDWYATDAARRPDLLAGRTLRVLRLHVEEDALLGDSRVVHAWMRATRAIGLPRCTSDEVLPRSRVGQRSCWTWTRSE